MGKSLVQSASALKTPVDYFTGRVAEDICIPRNIIVFSRKTARDLQRRTFESYPHHRFVLTFNLMTEGTVNVDGIHWRLRLEEVLLIFPYQFHHFIDLADEEILWLFITFEMELPAVMEIFRHRIVKIDRRCRELLECIIDNYKSGSGEGANRRLTLDCAILINHLREKAKSASRERNSPVGNVDIHSNALVRAVQDYLAKHAGSLPGIRSLAAELNMSESNLRAVFRQRFNISLGAYVKNYRAHQAILLMHNPSLSLTEIAFELGFTTLSSFSRFFSKTIGFPPREYRRKLAQVG